MKTLNIESSVAKRLAEIALFERIQATLNLHPGKLAKSIKERAVNAPHGPLIEAQKLKPVVVELLESILKSVAEYFRFGQPYLSNEGMDKFQLMLSRYFRWDPYDLMIGIESKAQSEGLSPAECAEYLALVAPKVAEWTFDQAMEIIQQDSK